jgi:hypothetical protein
MKTTEMYLAELFKALEEFQHTEFRSSMEQDNHTTYILSLREKMLADMDQNCDTTYHYWECDCKDKYIHSKTKDKCEACGCTADDSSDARISDVVRNMMKGEYLAKENPLKEYI